MEPSEPERAAEARSGEYVEKFTAWLPIWHNTIYFEVEILTTFKRVKVCSKTLNFGLFYKFRAFISYKLYANIVVKRLKHSPKHSSGIWSNIYVVAIVAMAAGKTAIAAYYETLFC